MRQKKRSCVDLGGGGGHRKFLNELYIMSRERYGGESGRETECEREREIAKDRDRERERERDPAYFRPACSYISHFVA